MMMAMMTNELALGMLFRKSKLLLLQSSLAWNSLVGLELVRAPESALLEALWLPGSPNSWSDLENAFKRIHPKTRNKIPGTIF